MGSIASQAEDLLYNCIYIFDAVNFLSSFLWERNFTLMVSGVNRQLCLLPPPGNNRTLVNEKSKTRNMFLLHYKVYCDYTYGYCVNQYPLYRNHDDWGFIVLSVCHDGQHIIFKRKQADWWLMTFASALITPTDNVFYLNPPQSQLHPKQAVMVTHPLMPLELGANEQRDQRGHIKIRRGSVRCIYQSCSVFSVELLCAALCCFFL